MIVIVIVIDGLILPAYYRVPERIPDRREDARRKRMRRPRYESLLFPPRSYLAAIVWPGHSSVRNGDAGRPSRL